MTPIAFAAFLASASVGAQVTPSGAPVQTLPEVRVAAPGEPGYRDDALSSPKATAPLVDTPQTVQVIPKEVFNEQGARNLTEVLRNTPGITFNAGENGFSTDNSSFSLRGFDVSGSIFVDGFRDSGTFSRDAFNLEQVEVIKGPAADNGRGAAGGYVNLETKTPRRENFITGTVGYGFDSYDSGARKRASADVNRVVGDNAAVRLNFLTEDSGVAGREHARQRSLGFAPSLTLGLGGPTTFTLAWQHTRKDDRPDFGVPAATLRGMQAYSATTAGFSRDSFYGLMSDYDDSTSDAVLLKFEHQISPSVRISNHTRWSKTSREAMYTVPTGYTPGTQLVTTQRQAYKRDNDSLSNLTNLSASFEAAGLKHTLAAGLELTREESDASRFAPNGALGTPGTTPLLNPNPNRPLGGFVGLNPVQTARVDIKTVALYAYDTIEFSPKWQLTGGVRLERYQVALQSRLVSGAPLANQDGFERSETTLGGKLGLVYKPTSDSSLYASYGRSALPPGSYLSNSDISRDGDNAFPGWNGQSHRNSKEQISTNYELGAKWDLMNRRLSTSAALFRTERTNVAMGPNAVAPAGYGKQTVQGLELGIAGAVTPAWSVFGGLTLMNSERRHSAAIDAALLATPQGPGDYGGATTTNGDELAFTPKAALNLWSTYRIEGGWTLGAGVLHVGSSWIGRPDTADRVIKNGRYGKLPSYTVFNLMAAYEVSRNFGIRLNIDNVTDKTYASSSNWGGSRVILGAPRTFLVSADMRF